MHPSSHIPSTPTTSLDVRQPMRALAAIAVATAVAGVSLAAAAYLTGRPTAEPERPAAINAAVVVDGWSSYLGAAARPTAREAVDGWSSYLLVAEPDAREVRDGWSSYLLAPEIDATTVVDGWMSRYGRDD